MGETDSKYSIINKVGGHGAILNKTVRESEARVKSERDEQVTMRICDGRVF